MAKGNFNSLINQDKPLLVDFFATWCGPCQAVGPILKEVANQVGEKVKIVKIDIDKNPALANQFQVRAVPTMMLFQNGQVKWRQSGVVPAQMILQEIQKIA